MYPDKKKWWSLSPFQVGFYFKEYKWKKRKKMNIVFHTVTFVCIVCAQLCLTLCNPMDFSPPGSFVCGILQARILEWLAIFFYRGSSRSRDRIHISCISCIELSPALEKDLPFEPPWWMIRIQKNAKFKRVIMKQIPGFPCWPTG